MARTRRVTNVSEAADVLGRFATYDGREVHVRMDESMTDQEAELLGWLRANGMWPDVAAEIARRWRANRSQ